MNPQANWRRDFLIVLFTCGMLLSVKALACGQARPDEYRVRSYGAKGDGKSNDTRAIQAAIDECNRHGGGTVEFQAGTFLSGSLHLKSGVCLHLGHGTTLLASTEPGDFDPYEKLSFKNAADEETSYFHRALIWAEDAQRIAITGTGTIDGHRKKRGGPKPIALKRCKLVTVRGITILNSPNYCISLLGTDHVAIDGITILNGYSDGIDPDCCRHVRISNCHIESWDDAIVAKTSFSLGERRSTEDLVVSNCSLATNCNAFKLGTESGGDFRNIAVSNCAMFARPGMRPPISGISLLSVDGSRIEAVALNNITMTDVRCPVFLRLGNRGRDQKNPAPGCLRNVMVNNVVAKGAQWPSAIAGIPDHPVEEVTLSNLRIDMDGSGFPEASRQAVPEYVDKYPSADMFGPLPACGLYCRHARHVRLSGVHLRANAPAKKAMVVCEDLSDLDIDSLHSAPVVTGSSVLRFHQVRHALIRGCVPGQGTEVFLKISGAQSDAISLIANDLAGATRAFELDRDVSKGIVAAVGNPK